MADRYNGGIIGPDNPASAPSCSPATTEAFTSSGTYCRPAGVQTVDVVVVGRYSQKIWIV